MNKRERLEQTFSGDACDRTPVALWRHWQGDDHRAADLAYAIAGFQQTYDWDYAVVAPSNHYLVMGYGLQDRWNGNLIGKREVIRTPIERSVDWTTLRPLDPSQGDIGKVVQTLQLLKDPFSQSATPYLLQIYSPLTQALQLTGRETLLRHMRTQPDRVRTGLNTLTESTLRLLDVLKRLTGIAGIVYTIETASFDLLSENEYLNFGLPFDQKVLDAIPASWWFTMIHMYGNAPMLHLFANAPVQVLNWQDQQTIPSLDRAEILFSGALAGGLGEEIHLLNGTPAMIREAGRKMMHVLPRRFILTSGGPISMATPISHIRAVRELIVSTSSSKDG